MKPNKKEIRKVFGGRGKSAGDTPKVDLYWHRKVLSEREKHADENFLDALHFKQEHSEGHSAGRAYHIYTAAAASARYSRRAFLFFNSLYSNQKQKGPTNYRPTLRKTNSFNPYIDT